MRYNYCTVFDKGYLNRGLALYYSVLKYNKEPFRHFILCADDVAYEILSKMNLKYVAPFKLHEVENSDPKILEAKGNRNHTEYMWTLSSFFTHYILTKYEDIEYVTYLDADLYFYASPEIALQDMGNSSVLITPHNLASKKREEIVGKYNVGMVIFKNDANGSACLKWWKDECLKWCYDSITSDKYGDQKYLDYFEQKFKGVFVYHQKGACLAGWNIRNYVGKIFKKNGQIQIDGDTLIFFHFSQWRQYFPKSPLMPFGPLGAYDYIFPPSLHKKLIYNEYASAIYSAMDKIRKVVPDFTFGTISRPNILIQIRDVVIAYGTLTSRKIQRLLHKIRK